MKKIINQSEIVKITIFTLILALVVLIYDWPILRNIDKFYKDLRLEIGALEAQNQQGNSFTRASLDYQRFYDKLPLLKDLLKKNGQELELIKELENIAERTGLKQELSLAQTKQPWSEKIEQLNLTVKLQGGFSNLLDYLKELEKINFQLTVDSFGLKTADSPAAGSEIEAQLLLNTYWLK